MSQRYIKQDEYTWQVGYDNPCRGFYAIRYLDHHGPEEDADVLIGFGEGVELDELVERCAEHGLTLPPDLILGLASDRFEEGRPLTPLQQRIWDLFQDSMHQMGGVTDGESR